MSIATVWVYFRARGMPSPASTDKHPVDPAAHTVGHLLQAIRINANHGAYGPISRAVYATPKLEVLELNIDDASGGCVARDVTDIVSCSHQYVIEFDLDLPIQRDATASGMPYILGRGSEFPQEQQGPPRIPVPLTASASTAGGMPYILGRDGNPVPELCISVTLQLTHPCATRPSFTVKAMADTGCSFPLLTSPTTWDYITAHCGDTVEACHEQVLVAGGHKVVLTEKALVRVSLTLRDGTKVTGGMCAYKSDSDILGLVGLEELCLLVDTPRKCLVRPVLHHGGYHYKFGEDEPEPSDAPPCQFRPKIQTKTHCELCKKPAEHL